LALWVIYLPPSDEWFLAVEGLQNSCGKPAPASGMQRKADFAVNSGAIDRKSQRRDAPSGGMRAAQRVLQTFPMAMRIPPGTGSRG
jgi:hypothetical protein